MNKNNINLNKKDIIKEEKKIENKNYDNEDYKFKKLLLEKEEESKKNLELAKYFQAELENIKKRHKKEVIDIHNYAIKNFSRKLLNILDSIEQGIDHINNNKNIKIKTLKEGLEMTYKMFIYILKDFKIELINTNGEKFDPEKHEAISIIKNSNKENNTIINTLQKGYTINKKILRSAKVVVYKNN